FSPRAFKRIFQNIRSHHPGIASGLTIGVAALGARLVLEFRQTSLRTWRAFYDRHLCHVAHSSKHSSRRACRAAGLPECCSRLETLPRQNSFKSAHSRNTSL